MYKLKKCIFLLFVGLGILTCLIVIMPGTKCCFPSYWLFRMTADEENYLKKLPDSAHDLKYYVKEGLFKDKSGYKMALSVADYKKAKQELLDTYCSDYPMDYIYCYDGNEKRALDIEYMEELQVDFLDEFLALQTDLKKYYILAEFPQNLDSKERYCGVICNDETCEIIEFTRYQYVAR